MKSVHPILTLTEALAPFRPLFAAIPGGIFGAWLLATGAPGWCVLVGAGIVTAGLGYGNPS